MNGGIHMKRILSVFLLVALCLSGSVFSAAAVTGNAAPAPLEIGFSDCNGVKIEYAIYGNRANEPLVLLPSNGNSMHEFDGNVLSGLSEHYMVITVSPRGSGRSDRGEGRLTFEVMCDDLLCLLDNLHIERTRIFGFSDGGNLGIVFTCRYPERVSRLAIMGANINTRGTKTIDQIGIVVKYWFLCLKAMITDSYDAQLERDIQGMMVGQPNLTFDDLAKINIPVLNIYGEHDMIKRSHSKQITKSIPNAEELMVIGGAHSSCFDFTDTVLLPKLLEFFAK
ncbi:MAG TPA: hypothetical protein DDY98_07775 [Ruminococcaceae bacterium]|nr:hypothetical protein [Oscillospiraceae bacterium]